MGWLLEAIEKVLDLAPLEKLEYGGQLFSTKELYEIKTPMVLTPVDVHTLKGVVDYLKMNPDNLDPSKVLVRVIRPDIVWVESTIREIDRKREFYVRATISPDVFAFGHWLVLEEFIIGLQSLFVEDYNQKRLLKVVCNITKSKSRQVSDDGISQRVVITDGFEESEVDLPNPVTLSPFRTFPEVAQPSSKFVLRKKADDEQPKCMLVEADGEAWQLEAMLNIAKFLNEALAGLGYVVMV